MKTTQMKPPMKPSRSLLAFCLGFAVIWSGVLVAFVLAGYSAGPPGGSVSSGFVPIVGLLSIPLTAVGWLSTALTAYWWRGVRRSWRQSGFSDDVYDLMVRMKGASSRLALLKFLDAPKHRNELSHLSGLDWKEVDREIGLLERYGLVELYAESGTVKMYKLSEQGRSLLKLIGELGEK